MTSLTGLDAVEAGVEDGEVVATTLVAVVGSMVDAVLAASEQPHPTMTEIMTAPATPRVSDRLVVVESSIGI